MKKNSKKNEPQIDGLGKDVNKLIVQKSKPIYELWRSSLTLAEFKILDVYLGRIDSHQPDRRMVVFKKGELEKILGITKISVQDLDNRLTHLMTPIRVNDNMTKKGFTRIALFEKAVAEADDDGLWQVKLECTPSAMRYFFDIEHLSYLRYSLRCIMPLTSRYAYVMFVYLESNRRLHLSWEVSLDKLKMVLNCESEETYKEYKRFNDLILKKAQKELHDKTPCRYAYEPIRSGRKVAAIRFALESVGSIPENDHETSQLVGQETFDDPQSLDSYVDSYSKPQTWQDILAAYLGRTATEEEVELVSAMLNNESRVLPEGASLDERICKYIRAVVAKVQESEARRKKLIKNRYVYLMTAIQSDIDKASKSQQDAAQNENTGYKGSTYHNFKERTDNNYTQMILDRYSKKE